MLPAVRTGEVDQPARRQCGSRRCFASLVEDSQPESVIGARGRRRWFISARSRLAADSQRAASDIRRSRRHPRGAPSPVARASDSSPCSTISPDWKRIPRAISRHSGVRRSRNSRSMLKCLNSSPCASRMIASASASRLDSQALLVPADRFGLLGQRRTHACKRARPCGQLVRAARGTDQSPYGLLNGGLITVVGPQDGTLALLARVGGALLMPRRPLRAGIPGLPRSAQPARRA